MIRLKVKEIARAKGISMGKLGRMADVDVKTIRRIYQNPTDSITLAVLDRIAEALGVNASELIDSVDPTEEPLP
jgi:DNA-binding Xre family transcriptional regulator